MLCAFPHFGVTQNSYFGTAGVHRATCHGYQRRQKHTKCQPLDSFSFVMLSDRPTLIGS